MTCDEYERMTEDLLDGSLYGSRCAALFTHLGDCKGCERYFRAMIASKNAGAASVQDRPQASPSAVLFQKRTGPRHAAPPLLPGRPVIPGLFQRRFSLSVASAFVAALMLILWTMVISSMLRPAERRDVIIGTGFFPTSGLHYPGPDLKAYPMSSHPR